LAASAGILIVSDFAVTEVAAVVMRDVRTGKLRRDDALQALADLDALRASCERLAHGPEDFRLAEVIVRDETTKLGAADALHLAGAVHAKAALATFDDRLAEAARARGVDIEELG
jgi:predicted nucleic acid-binding protein